jgi:hypothetical protein
MDPRVAANARHAEQAAFVIEEIFEAIGVGHAAPHQMDDRPGIDPARASCHRKTVECGKAHAGVYADGAIDGAEAGAAAQMSNHDLSLGYFRRDCL